MTEIPKFCMWCGKSLMMRYIGDNPENGPAQMRCSGDLTHSNLEDEIEVAEWKRADRPPEDILFELVRSMKENLHMSPNYTRAHDDLDKAANQLGVMAHRVKAIHDEVQALDDAHWSQVYEDNQEFEEEL